MNWGPSIGIIRHDYTNSSVIQQRNPPRQARLQHYRLLGICEELSSNLGLTEMAVKFLRQNLKRG